MHREQHGAPWHTASMTTSAPAACGCPWPCGIRAAAAPPRVVPLVLRRIHLLCMLGLSALVWVHVAKDLTVSPLHVSIRGLPCDAQGAMPYNAARRSNTDTSARFASCARDVPAMARLCGRRGGCLGFSRGSKTTNAAFNCLSSTREDIAHFQEHKSWQKTSQNSPSPG